MRHFLEALAETYSVKDACKAVGMSRQSAYRLRSRLVGQPFDLAWEAALEHGLRQLGQSALELALSGVPEPVFYQGEQVGTRTRYLERLMIFMLANPQRVGRNHLARDYSAHTWAGLMDRIEHGPLNWEETPPPRGKKARTKAEREQADTQRDFYDQSHYSNLAPKTRVMNRQGIELPPNLQPRPPRP